MPKCEFCFRNPAILSQNSGKTAIILCVSSFVDMVIEYNNFRVVHSKIDGHIEKIKEDKTGIGQQPMPPGKQ
jgi:6-phosphofructokinase